MHPLITITELDALGGARDLVLLDARGGRDAAERYSKGHLEGARLVDLDRDLARHPEDASRGGRHPLPELGTFATRLGELGITPESRVVIYDDQRGANAASRTWWMLRAIGHERVQVLDGGIEAAREAGWAIVTEPPRFDAAPPYPARGWSRPVAEADEVAAAASDPRRLVIDVRDPVRFRGERDVFDPNAGHIEGAVNIPYATNLGPDGRFLSLDALREKYRAALGGRAPVDVILQCGSGVTACHTLLAMEAAGLGGAKLYVGSWSEWSRSGRPVAKGE